MDISNLITGYNNGQLYGVRPKEKGQIKREYSDVNDPLDFYKNLCKDFPDISFRLSDNAEAEKTQYLNSPYLGYNNSMNQIGENFGGCGQCSISLDIAVVRKMQTDDEYCFIVRGMIDNIRREYAGLEESTKADGFMYTSASIEDDKGRPQRIITESNAPYSTEEQIRQMWSTQKENDKYSKVVTGVKNDLFETFLEMTDKSMARKIKLEGSRKKDYLLDIE